MEDNLINIYGVNDLKAVFFQKETNSRSFLLEKHQYVIEEYCIPYKNTYNHKFLIFNSNLLSIELNKNAWILKSIQTDMSIFDPKILRFYIKDPTGIQNSKEFRFNGAKSLSDGLFFFKKISNFDSWLDFNEYNIEMESKSQLISNLKDQIFNLKEENERLKKKVIMATNILNED